MIDGTGFESALGYFYESGFELSCPDDHVFFLIHGGKLIAIFNQTRATVETIQNECGRHLALHSEPVEM